MLRTLIHNWWITRQYAKLVKEGETHILVELKTGEVLGVNRAPEAGSTIWRSRDNQSVLHEHDTSDIKRVCTVEQM